MKKYLILFMLSSSASLLALPSGGRVIKGDATFSLTTDAVQIKANGKAIIHWDQFDIASREAVSFAQSQTKEAILNRVVNGSASQIYGLLQSNCPIYLINPQGVFIGSAAQISTAGFLASTADISNEAFWQGSELGFENLGAGKIVNLGTVTSTQGDVVFIARSIDNQGKITVPNGVVTFATSEVMLNPQTKQTVFIRVGEGEERIANSGVIQALAIDFKTQSPYEKAIHHTGTLEALTLQEQNGRIYLVADKGSTVIDGSVIASSGEVRLLGKEVSLQEHANVNVSGAKGGTVLIGGDYRGENLDILNSKKTVVEKGAQIKADAGLDGNGGKVIVWGDELMSFSGSISAEGGKLSGDGGFVEISAKSNAWYYGGEVTTRAPQGRSGTLLFDPSNITIGSGVSNPAFAPPTYNPPGVATANLNNLNLQSVLAGSNVLIATSNGVGGSGNVTFTANVTWATDHKLQVIADRNITNSAVISSTFAGTPTNNPLIDFQANIAGIITGNFDGINAGGTISSIDGNISCIGVSGTGGGGVIVSGIVKSTDNGSINLQGTSQATIGGTDARGVLIKDGGLVQVTNNLLQIEGFGGNTGNNEGILLSDGTVQSIGSGNIVLTGHGGTQPGGHGITLSTDGGIVQATGTGNITMTGYVGAQPASGVLLIQEGGLTALVQTQSGDITIFGEGLPTAVNNTVGVAVGIGQIETVTGAINITGIGYGGIGPGVVVAGTGVGVFATGSGSITINGTGNGISGTSENEGILVLSGAAISTQTGNLTCAATGGLGSSSTEGILVTGTGSTISSRGGAINLTGTGGGASTSGNGISVLAGAKVTNTGAGSITLNGTASPIGTGSNGIFVSGTSSAVTAASGSITATAAGSGTGANNIGLNVSSAGSISTTSGSITVLSATGSASGTTGDHGIFIDGNNSKITSASGAISLTGTGGGTGTTNQGIHLSNAGSITTTATAPITLTGAGSTAGTSSDEGIFLTNTSTKISTVNGPIQLTGTAGGGTTNGITVDSSATIATTTRGTITVDSSNNLAVQNNSILQTLGAGGPGLNDIAVTTNGVSVTAGALGPALISTVNGNIDINSSGANVTITGETSHALIQSTTKGSIAVSALNLIVQGGSAAGQTGITTPSGDITVECVQNCQYSAPTAAALAVMQTFGSNLTVVAGGSISLTGFSTISTPTPTGNLLMVAGQDISIGSTSQVMASGTVNSSLTLVVDNNFPASPGIGPGQFILTTGGIISAGAGTPVRIYTARRSQNTISAPINGTLFVAGPFDVNSSTEQWATYYPKGTYEGATFKIYYKEPGPVSSTKPKNLPNAVYTDIAANLVELADLLPILKTLRLPRHRFPSYHFQICEGNRESMYCAPTFSPYGSFIFEDDLYWIGVEF